MGWVTSTESFSSADAPRRTDLTALVVFAAELATIPRAGENFALGRIGRWCSISAARYSIRSRRA